MTHTIDTLPVPVKKFWKRRYALFENLMKEYTYHLNYGIVSQQNPSPNILQIYSAICCPMPHPGWIYVVEGGNTIQFAKIFDNIGALDINP